jgi:hypothetical protein
VHGVLVQQLLHQNQYRRQQIQSQKKLKHLSLLLHQKLIHSILYPLRRFRLRLQLQWALLRRKNQLQERRFHPAVMFGRQKVLPI